MFSDWQYAENADSVTMVLPKIKVIVDRASGSIRYYDAEWNLFLREQKLTVEK